MSVANQIKMWALNYQTETRICQKLSTSNKKIHNLSLDNHSVQYYIKPSVLHVHVFDIPKRYFVTCKRVLLILNQS